MTGKLSTIILFIIILTTLSSCKKDKKDNLLDPVIKETAYWIGSGTSVMEIFKGTIDSDGVQTINKLYSANPNDPLLFLVTNPDNNDLYCVELDLTPLTTDFVCHIYKGDTEGKQKQLILSLNQLMISTIALDPKNNKLYYSIYDEASISDFIYSCNTDGSNPTKLYTSSKFGDVVNINIDPANNKLYFVQNDLNSFTQKESEIYKGNLDGTGSPVLLYDKTTLPALVNPGDRFTGIALAGSSLYMAIQHDDINGMSYLLKGNTDGSIPAIVVTASNPTLGNNPMPIVMGLDIDAKHEYLYWLNRGNLTDGLSAASIYKIPVAPANTATPQPVFKNISSSGGIYGTIEIEN